jgi:hypothetical protein
VVAIEEEDGEDLREEDCEDLREEYSKGGERAAVVVEDPRGRTFSATSRKKRGNGSGEKRGGRGLAGGVFGEEELGSAAPGRRGAAAGSRAS